MKTLKELNLKENEIRALKELKQRLLKDYPDAEIIFYGSKARGDFDEESDIDILVLLNREVDDYLREEIFSMSFKVELKFDVIFGVLVESKEFWNSDLARAMPIHWNIDKEGIPVR